MSQTAQQFDFQISKEELVDILTHIEKGGLRIEFKGAEEVEGGITRLTLRHGMTAFIWGDKIVADVTANPDGSSHMNIVSSNSNTFSYGLHSKNISAIAQYIQKEISRKHYAPPPRKRIPWTSSSSLRSFWMPESSSKKNSSKKKKSSFTSSESLHHQP